MEARLHQALRPYALPQSVTDRAENLSYLEEVSVRPQVSASYKQEARASFELSAQHGVAFVVVDEIDNALVACMNALFLQSHQA